MTNAWLAVAYLVVLGSVVAFCAYGWLLRHVRPAAVSTYAFANPLVAIFIGSALLHEAFTGRMAVGAGFVVVAVVVVLLRPPTVVAPDESRISWIREKCDMTGTGGNAAKPVHTTGRAT